MADNFVDSPIGSEWIKTPPGNKGTGGGEYDGTSVGPFGEFKRTPSPNGVPEKITYEPPGGVGGISGEPDQFK